RGEIGERTREAAVRQTKSGGSTELLAVAHGNRTRNRPVSLTPRRRTPIADSRGFEAVSDAQRSRRYLTLFPGIRPGRGRDTGEKPTPNWRGASRSGDLDPWDCSNHVREGGPFDALLRWPYAGGFCSGTLKTFFQSNCTVAFKVLYPLPVSRQMYLQATSSRVSTAPSRSLNVTRPSNPLRSRCASSLSTNVSTCTVRSFSFSMSLAMICPDATTPFSDTNLNVGFCQKKPSAS